MYNGIRNQQKVQKKEEKTKTKAESTIFQVRFLQYKYKNIYIPIFID